MFAEFLLYLFPNIVTKMKRLLCVILLSIFVMACSSQPKRTTSLPQIVEPVKYTYSVKAVYPHDTNSYTQGLQFIDGVLWEGTGEWGKSVLQKVDLQSGKAEVLASLPKSEFGEGITVLGDKVYQLTWTNNKVHVYDLQGNHLKDMRYVGEGWGLTSDGESLYMSNGTTDIYKVNPETFKREGKITVTLRGEAVNFINELEWIDGKIWANVYTTDYVVIINPQTGIVEGMIDFTGLLKEEDMTERTDVLNGIAYDKEGGRIFVTGKLWNKLFEVEINK